MTKKITGLTKDEVLRSRERYGRNILKKEKTKGFFRRFFENLNDPIIKILIIALIVEVVLTFGNTNIFEVIGIVLAILIATTVSTASELGSERAFKRMESEADELRERALRDGELVELYSAADVFVNPTKEDNFPTVNIEAIACGTPVVTYNTGGSGEMLNEKCGIVVPTGDINALAKAIENINLKSEDCVSYAINFEKNKQYNIYMELYKNILNSRC